MTLSRVTALRTSYGWSVLAKLDNGQMLVLRVPEAAAPTDEDAKLACTAAISEWEADTRRADFRLVKG